MGRKNIVILGSTGSIGENALDVIRHHRSSFRILGLSARRNVRRLLQQIKEFSPAAVALRDEDAAGTLKETLFSWKKKPKVFSHADGLEQLAKMKEADFVLSGVVGSEGLLPLLAALTAGKVVGLANKEALVSAGDIIMKLSRQKKANIIPVDSEHSAIFQCLKGHEGAAVSRIVLTASGGPFYQSERDFASITVEEALNHPTWRMGEKITIDSATLMNKGLEAIEAHHLFNIPMEKISIVIHPQSIVHSLVEFEDGAALAQLSMPDMRLPIQYALTYPHRCRTSIQRLELEKVKRLDFAAPDFSRFPCLRLALEAGRTGGTAPVVLSSSNEIAVAAFVGKRLPFSEIPRVVEKTLKKHTVRKTPSLDDILTADRWAREEARNLIGSMEAALC
ncbi:MAG: 1-deoxy-D-xylulose-5-phosphate reductoisomerase [Elusimicrobia bacterium]|nr:1-deoxy-D-xylulose-5-phosphate reductoisomerase [Candidatus Obscuribacterium magneticum]